MKLSPPSPVALYLWRDRDDRLLPGLRMPSDSTPASDEEEDAALLSVRTASSAVRVRGSTGGPPLLAAEEGGRRHELAEEDLSGVDMDSAAKGALIFWCALHGGALLSVLRYDDSWLLQQWAAGRRWPAYLFVALAAATGALFYAVHGSDPGFIEPSDAEAVAAAAAEQAEAEGSSEGSGSGDEPDGSHESDSEIELAERQPLTAGVRRAGRGWRGHSGWSRAPTQYCERCGFVQPLRARHCADCGRCVGRFDQHCFWINTCVGEWNHARFLCFVAAEAALGIWTLLVLFTAFPSPDPPTQSWSDYIKDHGLICCSFVGVLCSLWFPVGLAVYHGYLAMTGQTSWEHLRGSSRNYYMDIFPAGYRPFDRGLRLNLRSFCVEMGAREGAGSRDSREAGPADGGGEAGQEEGEGWTECAVDAVGGPLRGCCSREPRRRPELLVWRLPCAPHEALPQDSLFDNRYYSCC